MTEALQAPSGVKIVKSEVQRRRDAMDADGWLFVKWVCGHGEKAVERFHRPLFYLLAGDATRLAACLEKYDSEVCAQVRGYCQEKKIDWRTPQGIRRLKKGLRRVNDRVSRSMAKTTMGLDAMLWLASRDPDVPCDLASLSGPDAAIAIASKSDPIAQKKMLGTIGAIMRSDAYARYYGDRLNPKQPELWINADWIQMAGRRFPGDQKTIEARGINSQWTSTHYDIIYADDIVGTESGEASTEDAIRWIAALEGISKPDALGGTRTIFNGTVYGPRDDNAVLASNDEYLSLRIPIWKKTVPSTLANIPVDGVPVLPEWYDIDACREKRKSTLASNSVGALGTISWLQNFELTAHEEGAMQFTAALLNQQKFIWVENTQHNPPRREIRRYLYNKDGSPKLRPNVTGNKGCRCREETCHEVGHDFVQFDPLALPRMLGVDQALVLNGDYWGIGCVAIDPYGVMYALRGEYGQSYWRMVPAIPIVFNRWGGQSHHPPDKVGMESNTWQSISADWIKRSSEGGEFQYLARRIEALPPTQTAKLMRIMNYVYANLLMRTLYIDPDDTKFEECALKYNAAEPDRQWDDPLDCVAMAVQLHRTPASNLDDAAMTKLVNEQQRQHAETYDATTWIDTSTDFMDYGMEGAWN